MGSVILVAMTLGISARFKGFGSGIGVIDINPNDGKWNTTGSRSSTTYLPDYFHSTRQMGYNAINVVGRGSTLYWCFTNQVYEGIAKMEEVRTEAEMSDSQGSRSKNKKISHYWNLCYETPVMILII